MRNGTIVTTIAAAVVTAMLAIVLWNQNSLATTLSDRMTDMQNQLTARMTDMQQHFTVRVTSMESALDNRLTRIDERFTKRLDENEENITRIGGALGQHLRQNAGHSHQE